MLRISVSTLSLLQDTVVALQALSMFAQRIYGHGLDVIIDVKDDDGIVRNFHVLPSNSITLQQEDLNKVMSQLYVTARGEGCIMLQVR